ncbi:SDR family oxidoreductase [Candidatus Peregrinibacteria bacterium]|nr:SDR family oxidoreductase [Candidatus Peregrinibacteria bacterium]
MRILVTGGAGFIGSHLCEKLLLAGHTVVALDNFLTGSEENVAGFVKNPSFSLIRHDIVQPLKFRGGLVKTLGSEPLDFIFHLACPASPIDYQKYPLETLLASSEGTKNILDFALPTKTRVLFASTSEVYGDPLIHPQKEDYSGNVNPIGPRSCYDEGKRYAESLCVHYSRIYSLPITIIRIFNTYGPRMRQNDGRVIPNFIMQALSGMALSLNGDGSQTRSFCYVSDMVDGLISAMKGESPLFGPINLGNPEETSIHALAALIIRLTNSRSMVSFHSALTDDPRRRCPDISLAKETLGFSPNVSLEEGLQKTIEWFKKEG